MAKKSGTEFTSGDPLAAIDADLVRSAVAKLRVGDRLTSDERRAYKAFEKKREEESMRRHYSSVPQKMWREWSGRQTKVLKDQAQRYGIPIGATIDLSELALWLHDFFAKHGRKFSAPETDDPELQGTASPALEEQRREKAIMLRLQRLEREGTLVDKAYVDDKLEQLAAVLRRAGERLERRYDSDAKAILDEAINGFRREHAAMWPGDVSKR